MTAWRRSVPLLLMFFTVTAGLFTMHTLGHPREHSGMTSTPMQAAVSEPMPHQAVMMAAVMAGAGTDTPVTAESAGGAIGSGHQPGMPSDPGALCLAILCTVLLIAVALMLVGRTWRQQLRALWLPLIALATMRGPPAPRMGLRLADLSVLRN